MSGESADQARTRRRWVTLAELLAVAGVTISGLSLYKDWSKDRATQAQAASRAASAGAAQTRFAVTGTINGDAITLAGSGSFTLNDVSLTFPPALAVPPRDAVTHRIEADWFDEALMKATDGGADDRSGRLPVLLRYTYSDGTTDRRGSAVYDIVWETKARALRSRLLTLVDFRRREAGGEPARLDALWAQETR